MKNESWNELIKVTVAADDAIIARLIEKVLSCPHEGSESRPRFKVDHVSVLQDVAAQFDHQLTDAIIVSLRHLDAPGLQQLAGMRRLLPELPLMVVTDHDDSGWESTVLTQGADECLQSNQTRLLPHAIRYLVARRRVEKTACQKNAPTQNHATKSNHSPAFSGDLPAQPDLESQLRHMQKLDTLGQLAAGIAHDFNNVLTVVIGHADLLLLEKNHSPRTVESLNQISLASHRAANLTRQLLAFSRKQTMQLQPLDMNEVVANFSRMLRRVLGQQVLLACIASEKPARVRADAGMMEQVLMNLAVNARDAMPTGGELRIQTEVLPADHEFSRRPSDASAGEHVLLSVTDTGGGIDPEILPRIFEPFFTTKAKGNGTGLGLAIVYGIVKQHGGWLDVDSHPGEGTVFKIYLPVCGQPTANGTLQPQPRIG